ncbi:hypothetical protein TrVFT333_003242 [Trichoderma virens FT-333]|nr:hypothetical protein TrVFT333_003242 [Trichoderma virens FT-333]
MRAAGPRRRLPFGRTHVEIVAERHEAYRRWDSSVSPARVSETEWRRNGTKIPAEPSIVGTGSGVWGEEPVLPRRLSWPNETASTAKMTAPSRQATPYLGRQPSDMEADHRGAEHRVPPWSLGRGRRLGRGHAQDDDDDDDDKTRQDKTMEPGSSAGRAQNREER